MKRYFGTTAGLLLGAFCSLSAMHPALADDKPPPGAMALSMVLTKLEQQGYTPIVEVSLENEHWEVEAYKEGQKHELKVDPNTGEILEGHEDSD